MKKGLRPYDCPTHFVPAGGTNTDLMKKGLRLASTPTMLAFSDRTNTDLMKKGLRLTASLRPFLNEKNEHRPDEKGIATQRQHANYVFPEENEHRPDEKGIATPELRGKELSVEGTNTDLMKKGLRLPLPAQPS